MTITTAPPPPARTWTGIRLFGSGLLFFWCAAGFALIYFLIANYDAEFYARYTPKFLNGLLITLQIVGFSLILGAGLSLPVAMGRNSQNPVAASSSYAFVYFFRGTPLIAQTFLVYYGAGSFRTALDDIGLWTFFREPYFCVIFTFSLNTAAYQAEILRGAIRNVPKGQREAGQSLGMSKLAIFWKITLPQALIIALRPYGNEVVLMVKGSAIASIVTVFDLMGETRRAFSRTFDFQTYIWAAIIYLVIVEVLRRVWDLLEARLTRHLKRATEAKSTDDDKPKHGLPEEEPRAEVTSLR